MNVVCLYHGITAQRAIVFSFFHRSISSLRGRNLADPAETGRDNYAKETRQKARRCSLRRFHREDASRLVPRSFVPDMTFAGFVPGIYADHRRQSRERFNVRRIYCTCAFGKFVGDRWIGRCRDRSLRGERSWRMTIRRTGVMVAGPCYVLTVYFHRAKIWVAGASGANYARLWFRFRARSIIEQTTSECPRKRTGRAVCFSFLAFGLCSRKYSNGLYKLKIASTPPEFGVLGIQSVAEIAAQSDRGFYNVRLYVQK